MSQTLGAITLPAGLIWVNEYEWHGIARAIEPSVTGVPIIQSTLLSTGRSIRLEGSDAWLSRTDLDTLGALVSAEGPHLLTLHDGRSVNVSFAEVPLLADPVVAVEDPQPGTKYRLRALNLITTGAMNPPPEPEE